MRRAGDLGLLRWCVQRRRPPTGGARNPPTLTAQPPGHSRPLPFTHLLPPHVAGRQVDEANQQVRRPLHHKRAGRRREERCGRRQLLLRGRGRHARGLHAMSLHGVRHPAAGGRRRAGEPMRGTVAGSMALVRAPVLTVGNAAQRQRQRHGRRRCHQPTPLLAAPPATTPVVVISDEALGHGAVVHDHQAGTLHLQG